MVARLCFAFVVIYAAVGAVRLDAAGKATITSISLLALAISPIMLVLWRAAIAGVRVEEAGARIVNLTRTHFIPWEDIRGFSLGPLHLLPKVGILELHSGKRLGIWSIQGPNPMTRPNNTSAEKLVEALNGELAQHASGRTTSPTT